MEQYLASVYAGLTGSVTMITCTVLALTRLVFEYKGKPADFQHLPVGVFMDRIQSDTFSSPDAIEVTTMEQLLQNICLLLSSRTREIVKAALGFIKVILFIMDPKTLASHVAVMVGIDIMNTGVHCKRLLCPNLMHSLSCIQMEGIGNIKDDVRRHFRAKLKNIFTKFIRKFG